MTKVSLNKTYRTKDGRQVRLFADDGGKYFPILGAWRSEKESRWFPCGWTEDGKAHLNIPEDSDLVEVPKRIKRTVWLNVFPHETGGAHPDKETADSCGGDFRSVGHKDRRLACVKVEIDVEEGEGL